MPDFKVKMHQYRFRLGDLTALPRPSSWILEALLLREGDIGRKGRGRRRRLTSQRRRTDVIIKGRRPLTSQRRRTDVSERRRPTPQRRRTDVMIRRRLLTSQRRCTDVIIRRRLLTSQRCRTDVTIRRRPLTSQIRRTDVTERRRTSQGRHLEFTVLRRHDVGIRRRWDQFMTT